MTVIMRISHVPRPDAHKRGNFPTPGVITDTMAPIQSMLDGKLYDSKAALRATYRAAGVNEVGNDSSVMDPKPVKKPKPDKKAIRASVERAFSRAGLGA
jgi:hypothetical protein